MAGKRQDWAQVEWEFLRFDPDYKALAWDERVAYLHLWCTCVHVRISIYEKSEVRSEYLAELCGVTSELLVRTVRVSGSRLIQRGPRGSISVVGVKEKHWKLSGWNKKRLLADRLPDRTVTGTGPDQPPSPLKGGVESLRAKLKTEHKRLRTDIDAGTVRSARRKSDGFAFDTVTTCRGIIFVSLSTIQAEPRPVGRDELADYEWLPTPGAGQAPQEDE